jgi:hypothetical protein
VAAIAAGVLSLTSAYDLHQEEWWLPVFFAGFGILWFLVSWECFVSYMHLGDEALEYRMNFKRVRIRKPEIEKVTWELGCGVSVRLTNGSWENVPTFGGDMRGITNSVRAWLRKKNDTHAAN